MSQPLTLEQIWGVPDDELPGPSLLEAEEGWCPMHDTQCTFWIVNYSHTGCVLRNCKHFPEASPCSG